MAQIGSKVLDWLDLPIQTAMGWPQLTMEGNRRLRFENHRGIREYGENRVRILSDLGILCVEGEQLEIRVLGKSWIVVEGIIHAVRFEHHEQTGKAGHTRPIQPPGKTARDGKAEETLQWGKSAKAGKSEEILQWGKAEGGRAEHAAQGDKKGDKTGQTGQPERPEQTRTGGLEP